MGVKQRYQEADYLNVGGASTEEWALMGTGFSKIDDSPSAQTTSKRYVNNKSATKSVGSYDWSAPFEMDMIEGKKRLITSCRSVGKKKPVLMLKQNTSV